MPTSALPRGKTTTLLLKNETAFGTPPTGNWTQTFAYSHSSDFKKPFEDDQLYQPSDWVTLGGFPNRRWHDSSWQTRGVCHGPSGAD
jgi:hypothetical protein